VRWFVKAILCVALLQGLNDLSASCLVAKRGEGPENQGNGEAGPYVIGNNKERSKKEADVRNFLWHHWSQRTPGRLSVTRMSKEGQPNTATYVLESDDSGVWGLRTIIDRPSLKGTSSGHNESRAYSVRRIEIRHDGKSAAIFIPDNDDRPGDSYRLVFYDSRGVEVGGA